MINEMKDIPIAEAVEIALQAKKSWTEPNLKHFEFEIRKQDGTLDIEFVRRGRNLKVGTGVSCDGRGLQDGDVWKTDIIQVSGETARTPEFAVQIILSGDYWMSELVNLLSRVDRSRSNTRKLF